MNYYYFLNNVVWVVWRRSVFPKDSRTLVPDGTWAGLTAGFGKGPGVPRRRGRQNQPR